MNNIGIHTNLEDIRRLRASFRELKENLEHSRKETELCLETVSHTWKDNKFVEFRSRFYIDQQTLDSVIRVIDGFEKEYLNDVENRIRRYLGEY